MSTLRRRPADQATRESETSSHNRFFTVDPNEVFEKRFFVTQCTPNECMVGTLEMLICTLKFLCLSSPYEWPKIKEQEDICNSLKIIVY